MKPLKVVFAILVLLTFGQQLYAQLKMTAELRTRGEVNNGYKYIPDSASETQYYVSQRTRLNILYSKPKYDFYISLQDVRAWGDEGMSAPTMVLGSSYGLDIFEAWVKWNFSEKTSLKFGRQTYDFDDRRILCDRNWNQFGLSYDGALLTYKNKGFMVMLEGSYNSTQSKIIGDAVNKNNDYYDGSTGRMKTFNFVYVRKNFSDALYASLAAYLSGYQSAVTPSTIYGTGTYGLHLNYKKDDLEGQANAFYQNGKNFAGKSISGLMATVYGQYNGKKVILGAGFDHYSGADGTDTTKAYNDKIHTFNLMYGARYPYNGHMAIFMLMDKHTKNGGLNDLNFKAGYKFNKKSTFTAAIHVFSTPESVLRKIVSGQREYYDQNLGSELDLTYKYVFSKEVIFQTGFSYYFANETIEAFRGSGAGTSTTPFWGYVMVTFKPTLHESKDN